MLEEFCKVCGYNRKYAIWLLSRPLSSAVVRRVVTRRSATYSKASIVSARQSLGSLGLFVLAASEGGAAPVASLDQEAL